MQVAVRSEGRTSAEHEQRLILTVLAQGSSMRRSFPEGMPVWVGRDEGCHVCAPSKSVSRRHVRLTLEGEEILIEDDSSSGTSIHGERLHRRSAVYRTAAVEMEVGPYSVLVERVSERRVDGVLRKKIHEELLERLELARFPIGQGVSPELRRQVEEQLDWLVAERGVPLERRAQLAAELRDEALGFGPLEGLLRDPNVAEIMVVDAETIFVERGGKLEQSGQRFSSDDTVRSVLERIVSPLGRRIDESNPMVDARLPDGSRVNAVIPPLALKGPTITIRKFRRGGFDVGHLVRMNSLTEEMAEFLLASVRAKRNIVVSGGTGSGKTTLLNLLSSAISDSERTITIEDAAELQLSQRHVVSLEARPRNLEGRGEVTIRDLLRNALRMRPDRILVGECRGGEALDMLQAMNTGHEGSMTTTHANSPREALMRLETLCLMSGVELPLAAIRRQLGASVHLIVQQSRLASGERKVTSISEVTGVDRQGELRIAEIFAFDPIESRFRRTGYLPSFQERLEFLPLGGGVPSLPG